VVVELVIRLRKTLEAMAVQVVALLYSHQITLQVLLLLLDKEIMVAQVQVLHRGAVVAVVVLVRLVVQVVVEMEFLLIHLGA
jgi:hypothetical protein